MKDRKNYVIAPVRMILFVFWVLAMSSSFIVARTLRIPNYNKLPHVFHAGVCRIFGINVTTSGDLCDERPTLYLSNHISYVDVFVLGQVPGYFIAKAEVASWPIMGKMAQFQNTLFVERKAGRAKQQLATLQQHLQEDNSLILFPEGTSTNGCEVKPFKPTLIESANLPSGKRVRIQPITVAYTHYDNELITSQAIRDHYAWYANMPFTPHFLGLLPRKKVCAKVHFHPVCYLDDFATRKECAKHCENLVAAQLEKFVRGE